MDLFSLNWLLGESSQVEKMVRITPIYKRWKGQFGRGPTTRSFGELINIVISHLLNGSKWDDPPRLSGRGGQPKVYFTYHATSWTIQDVFFLPRYYEENSSRQAGGFCVMGSFVLVFLFFFMPSRASLCAYVAGYRSQTSRQPSQILFGDMFSPHNISCKNSLLIGRPTRSLSTTAQRTTRRKTPRQTYVHKVVHCFDFFQAHLFKGILRRHFKITCTLED